MSGFSSFRVPAAVGRLSLPCKCSIQRCRRDAGNPGRIGFTVPLQLAQNEIMPETHQRHALQAPLRQGLPGVAEDINPIHMDVPPVRKDHMLRPPAERPLVPLLQAGHGVFVCRNAPVRQMDRPSLKVHVTPYQLMHLFRDQACTPGQPQNHFRNGSSARFQNSPQSLFIHLPDRFRLLHVPHHGSCNRTPLFRFLPWGDFCFPEKAKNPPLFILI